MKPGDVIPSNSVVIPADVARAAVMAYRSASVVYGSEAHRDALLDFIVEVDRQSKPQTLRDKVHAVVCEEPTLAGITDSLTPLHRAVVAAYLREALRHVEEES